MLTQRVKFLVSKIQKFYTIEIMDPDMSVFSGANRHHNDQVLYNRADEMSA